MNTETNPILPDSKPPPNDHTAEDCQAILRRANGYRFLGLHAEAAAELDTIRPPESWRACVTAVRCSTTFAMGDMLRVVALGCGYMRTPCLPPAFYSLLAIALHNCGRWQEAVETELMRMNQYGATPDDHYGLACYLGKALQIEPALLHLIKGLRGCSDNALKALMDTDLQPFWARLLFTPLTPRMREVLLSPGMVELSRLKVPGRVTLTYDAADRPRLPAGAGRWMEFDGVSYLLTLSPSAPLEVRRRLREWSVSRIRATRRLVRRATERAKAWPDVPAGASSLLPTGLCGGHP
jgi:hypothetical protein